ncbi:sigma 54-interacting transcriptional regulator [bacterium]|nr:sigma 54-interacting transcriptional regulator [bacterium]
MKRILLPIIFSAAVLLPLSRQEARAERYFFRNYDVEEGLGSTQINSILQDRLGYLWFATTNGLIKFDGKSFTTFSTRDGLPSNNVFRIHQDSKGDFWLSFPGKGIGRFDGVNWRYYKDHFPPFVTTWSIMEDSHGNMWFATFGNGVVRFDGTNWTVFSDSVLGENRTRTVIEDSRGNIWVGLQRKGICVFDGKEWTNIKSFGPFYDSHINSIIEDKRGDIWLAGVNPFIEGTIAIKMSGDYRNASLESYTVKDGIPNGSDPVLLEDSQGRIWLAADGGLGVYDGRTWKTYNTDKGLPSNRITSLIEDSEKNIWIGTNGNGAARFSGEAFVLYTVADGLPCNSLVPMLADSRGNLWFTSENVKGAVKYDGERWTTLLSRDGKLVSCVYEDSRGGLWFNTSLTLHRVEGNSLRAFTTDSLWLEEVSSEDDKGNLYFTQQVGYQLRFNGRDFEEKPDKTHFSSAMKPLLFFNQQTAGGCLLSGSEEGLIVAKNFERTFLNQGMKFTAIAPDGRGGYWFGTDSGLVNPKIDDYCQYVTNHNRIESEFYSLGSTPGSNEIITLYRDRNGALWAGTGGGGISRLLDGKLTHFTTDNGLSSNVCYYIFETGAGLFFRVPLGLDRFDGKSFVTFTARNDGFFASAGIHQFSFAAVQPIEDKKGNFWFNSLHGVIKFDPSAIKRDTLPPPLYITRFRIAEKDTTLTNGLRLRYNQNSLKIDYIGISLSAPEEVVYSYKLEGLDTEWTETRLNSASYPYLPPGRYEFELRARNRDGIWNAETARLQFEILPPFWSALWFRALMLSAVLGLGWVVLNVRTRLIQKRNTELLAEITERKKVELALREKNIEVKNLKDRLQAENIYLQEEIKLTHNFNEIIGNSEALNKVLERVEKVAFTDSTVLILGETGTGKQLIARAVHRLSPRAYKPLVTINCASIPASLIESEMFGYEKGAFTGAVSRKTGRFELADGGSLFLDEIGELPLELQAKLLRVLQDGEFERLGSTNTIHVDVRIIAATNRDLEQEVSRGAFREDLYYRLNVYPIKCPPLREHKEDIPLLVNHFVNQFNSRIGKQISAIPQSVLDTLQAYKWPGNIRELQNVIERAVIVSSGSQLKLSECLENTSASTKQVLTLDDLDKQHIVNVMEMTGWRVRGKSGAAELLGLKPTTLEAKMVKLGVRKETPPRRKTS